MNKLVNKEEDSHIVQDHRDYCDGGELWGEGGRVECEDEVKGGVWQARYGWPGSWRVLVCVQCSREPQPSKGIQYNTNTSNFPTFFLSKSTTIVSYQYESYIVYR